jgi:hypothetical protein
MITRVRLTTEVSIPNTAPMANILPPEVKAISDPIIIMGETKTPNIIGLTVIFNKKPFKQLGKIALGSYN